MSQVPPFVKPMLAKLSTLPADESLWAFEVKWDGIRAIARSEPGHLNLLTRNEIDRTAHYPELTVLKGALGSHSAMPAANSPASKTTGEPTCVRMLTATEDSPSLSLGPELTQPPSAPEPLRSNCKQPPTTRITMPITPNRSSPAATTMIAMFPAIPGGGEAKLTGVVTSEPKV